jgi:hypothetical protein
MDQRHFNDSDVKVMFLNTAERLSDSGYWRLGSEDKGLRAARADWNRSVELAEAAAGA